MKSLLVSLVVFAVTAVASLPVWRAVERSSVKSTAAPPRNSPGHGDRTSTTHLTAQQQWLAHLRALLRAGDTAAVQNELNRMAREQPLFALAAIQRLANLGDQLDLSTPAAEAARRLPWGDARSVEALNLIGIHQGGASTAWKQYLAAQTGLRPPEEIYAEAQKASSWEGEMQDLYTDWVQSEVQRDPVGFATLLADAGSRDVGLWRVFFGALEARPDLYASILDQVPQERRREDCMYAALEAWLYASTTVETLSQASHYQPLTETCQMVSLRDLYADPGQRAAFLSFFAQRQPYEQSAMLSRMYFTKSGDVTELLPVLEMCPSLDSQMSVIRNWYSSSAADSPPRTGTDWFDQLPTEKLRARLHAEERNFLGR